MEHLRLNYIISDKQHGFLPNRSCITNLLLSVEDWSCNLDNNTPTDIIYLHFAKAFDRVPHQRLLAKLYSYGIRDPLLQWIKISLSNRTQRVKIEDILSSPKLVSSGIPQGSVLGPALFVVFINDLPENISNPMCMFADDTKVYTPIHSLAHSVQSLQNSINLLSQWSKTWQLTFNESKCNILTVQTKAKHHHHSYTFDLTTLGHITEEKDLGITIDSALSFKTHTENI